MSDSVDLRLLVAQHCSVACFSPYTSKGIASRVFLTNHRHCLPCCPYEPKALPPVFSYEPKALPLVFSLRTKGIASRVFLKNQRHFLPCFPYEPKTLPPVFSLGTKGIASRVFLTKPKALLPVFSLRTSRCSTDQVLTRVLHTLCSIFILVQGT